jgi:hypothetical protein
MVMTEATKVRTKSSLKEEVVVVERRDCCEKHLKAARGREGTCSLPGPHWVG